MDTRPWYLLGGCAVVAPAAALALQLSSPEQVDAGQAVYAAKCAACHGDALAGGMGPALAGPEFLGKWHGKSARALYGRILSTMPLSDPGSLSDNQAISVTNYILVRNGFAMGTTPVAAAEELAATQIP